MSDELQAGRELDALVAERVMGLPVKWSSPPYVRPGEVKREGRFPYLKGKVNGCEYDWADVPNYSTNIAAAWQVLDILPWQWKMAYDPGGWGVFTIHVDPNEDADEFVDVARKFNSPSDVPEAICNAAMIAFKMRVR